MRLAPMKDWEVNEPEALTNALQALEQVRQDFNGSQTNGRQVSLADLIVLAGAPQSSGRLATPATRSRCRLLRAAPTHPRK